MSVCECVCVCVFLPQLSRTKISSFLPSITLSSVACLTVRYSSTLPHKQHEFQGKKVIEHKICVSIFSTTFIRNLLRRIQRDIIINVRGLPVKCPLFLLDFIAT